MAVNNSNLPTTFNFKNEDYPDAPNYFYNFLSSLNLFIGPVYSVLNGGITYQNLQIPQIYTKTITAPAAGNVTFSFTSVVKIVPSSVLIGNVYVSGNTSSHPTNEVGVFWHYSQGTIYIDNITNLTPSTMYVVTLVVL